MLVTSLPRMSSLYGLASARYFHSASRMIEDCLTKASEIPVFLEVNTATLPVKC
ncbi:MAG: hypothetical protein FGF53_10580 [Candidatus Brockarchaeota archaeon]|nr:hypothetical protein [Candidatus Brockarchaeota archaeon]